MNASRRLRSTLLPLILGLLSFVVYNANLRQISAGDTLPARYLPLLLWHTKTLALEADARLVAHGYSLTDPRNRPPDPEHQVSYLEPWAYWLIRTREHRLASLYPVVTPLLVAPLYLPAVAWLDAHGWEQPQLDRVAEIMEKFSASVLASFTVVALFCLLRSEEEQPKWCLPLALVFAFGTNTWVISSQALWQHGTGELLVTLALMLALAPASALKSACLGAVCVLLTANRPPDAVFAGAFVLFAFWRRRRNLVWLLVGALLPALLLLRYNLSFIGNLGGGYALLKVPTTYFRPIWQGLPGLLASPGRGLLVFCPFCIFVPMGMAQRIQAPHTRGLAVALTGAVLAQVVGYSAGDWRAGVSWGPRWLTDMLPILIWMLAPVPPRLRPRARVLLMLTVAVSVGVQTVGAFWYTKVSDARIFSGDPGSMRQVWNPRNLPFLVELMHNHAHGDLRWNVAASLSRVGSVALSGREVAPNLESGMTIEGWVSTGPCNPFRLWVLVDGIVVGWTADFPRERAAGRYRWAVTAKTLGIAPGENRVQIAVTFDTGGNIRIVQEQPVYVVAPRPASASGEGLPESESVLAGMARRATELLRERQSKEGYWLTAFTEDLQYINAHPEMNTFLTSFLVDLLAPVARERGLEEVVERARKHLAAQIESNGLVRYHGLPSAPTIGTLGCVITPDADDTALVWRIAGRGAQDPRLQQMLSELARYRDARGLYRAWLAPPDQYQNLDPGNDPDPTDIGIQANVDLMLRQLDPPAGERLSIALQRFSSDGDLWVYYSQAPLIPYLRIAQLRRLGCGLALPTERLELPAPGQELWTEAVRLWVEAEAGPPNAPIRAQILQLLSRMGRHDFARLRQAPPLLYHNDLTANVRRFYWSEDFGYALWLRLFQTTRL